ncbi:MAG: sugar transferase [Lautropia sp.]
MRTLVHYFKFRFAFLPVLEGLVLFQAMVLGNGIRLIDDNYLVPVLHGLLFTAVMLLVMTALGLYAEGTSRFRYTVQRIFTAYLLTLTVLAVVFYAFPDSQVGRGTFGIASVLALLGLLLVRGFAYRAGLINIPLRRFLVLGSGEIADDVSRLLETPGRFGGRRLALHMPVEHFVGNGSDSGDRGVDAAAEAPRSDAASLLSIARERRITDIVVAVRELRANPIPVQALLACRLAGIRVIDLVTFHEEEQGLIKVDLLRASNLIYGSGFDQSRMRVLVKRSFDVTVAIAVLLLALPAMAIVALAIFLETGRPILFRQARVGEHNEEFLMLKFRSMRRDAESDGKARWAQKGDSRITRVGRLIRATRLGRVNTTAPA